MASKRSPRLSKSEAAVPSELLTEGGADAGSELPEHADAPVKPKRDKRKDYVVSMPESEHEALMALRQTYSELSGEKVKKSLFFRAAFRLMQTLPQKKVQATLTKILTEEKEHE